MVNSKKMSKSSVAMIVLSILLVLSMILGLTGAWYTANAAKTDGDEGSISFRNGWMTVAIVADGGAIKAYEGDKSTERPNDQVMPGDYLHIEGTTLNITTTYTEESGEGLSTGVGAAKVEAHLFLINGDNEYVAYVRATAGTAYTVAVSVGSLDDNDYLGTGENGWYQVNTTNDSSVQGKEIASFSFGGYSLQAIQVENIADEAAAATALGIDKSATETLSFVVNA